MWDVAFGVEEDLITASGDAVARVWTQEEGRKVREVGCGTFACDVEEVSMTASGDDVA